jgi:hypothetical protein
VASSFKRRLNKHLHPAWLAAHVLDPSNAREDDDGVWRLPFDDLSVDEQSDVIRLVARLSGSSNAAAEHEVYNLSLTGVPAGPAKLLGTIVAGAPGVQAGQQDQLADNSKRRGWWRAMAQAGASTSQASPPKFPLLAHAASRLLSAHVSTSAAERNWSAWGRHFQPRRASMKVSTAEKLIYIKDNDGAPHSGADFKLWLSIVDELVDEEGEGEEEL